MKRTINFIKRNCMVYLRDRSAVFFAFFAMFIVIILQVVFLGDMHEKSILGVFEENGIPLTDTIRSNAREMINYWTIAGIMIVNALSISISVTGIMVDDQSNKKQESFYCTPISRAGLAIGYIASSVIIGFFLCLVTLGVAVFYVVACGGVMLGALEICKIVGLIFLSVTMFSILMYMCAIFINSGSAWGGFSTLAGTLVGFVGAIYIPMGALPDAVCSVLKALPILHGASLFRMVFCEDVLNRLFEGIPADVLAVYKEEMGITLTLNDKVLPAWQQIVFVGLWGVAALVITCLITKKRTVSDR